METLRPDNFEPTEISLDTIFPFDDEQTTWSPAEVAAIREQADDPTITIESLPPKQPTNPERIVWDEAKRRAFAEASERPFPDEFILKRHSAPYPETFTLIRRFDRDERIQTG